MAYEYKINSTTIESETVKFSANVISYDGQTRLAVLDKEIDASLGTNSVKGDINTKYTLFGSVVNLATAVKDGTGVPSHSTNEDGDFVAVFNIPPGTFQTGQRVFRVDNRTVATDPETATAYAEATFTASGLATTSQKLEFAPSIDSAATSFTSVAQRSNQLVNTDVKTTFTPYDPVAQTFIIDKDNYPNGAFISSISVFFATKPATSIPVKLYIVGTKNGYPDGQKLDYSNVTLARSKIKVSENPHYLDPSARTTFKFKAPIYIQPNVLYAFVIETTSPDYKLYYGQQNSIAVPSTARENLSDPIPTNTTKIGQTPYVGGLFESQNSITWTVDQSKQLMFVIDRCVFKTNVVPSIEFGIPKNLPYRNLGTDDIQYTLNPDLVSNVTGNFASEDTWSDEVNLTTTDFTPTGTTVNYSYDAILASDNSVTGPFPAFPGRLGSPTPENITFDDGKGQRVLLKNIENSFSMYASLSSTDDKVSPIISDDGVSMYNVRHIINNMGLSNNVISITKRGNGYDANIALVVSDPDVGSEKAVLGYKLNASGNLTSIYVVSPGAGYITTPTISILGANTIQARATVSGETSARGGNSLAKYFTKKVVLAPGNESGDLRVFYSAYKPLGTSIHVYYKIMNKDDTQSFDSRNWQLMTQMTGANAYSTSKSDIIEFECAPGKNNQADNFISYKSTNGQTYDSFSQFAIKVVMASTDSTIIPILTDIRALALPAGTGF